METGLDNNTKSFKPSMSINNNEVDNNQSIPEPCTIIEHKSLDKDSEC